MDDLVSRLLYGKIRNTLAAVHLIRLRNGTGRTCIHTTGAGAAMVSNRTIRGQLQITDNLSQKKVGTCFFMNKVGECYLRSNISNT